MHTGHKSTQRIYELWDELADLPLAETRQSTELVFRRVELVTLWMGET